MNILLTIDRNFVPQASACIMSICQNTINRSPISFYILTSGIDAEQERLLTQMIEGFQNSLQVINIGNIYQYFDPAFDTAGWNEIILARLLMGRFLPQHVQRILYLDADTIVRSDISQLFCSNLDGCVIGAVREPTATINHREILGLHDMKYYNSGVLLVDLRLWRQKHIENRLLTYCEENREKLFASDQDAINGALAGMIKELPPSYNYCNTFDFYPYSALAKMTAPANYLPEDQFLPAIKNPVIIHFLGEERPWRKGSTHRFRDEYLRYLSETPFASTPLEEGWGNYFKAWKLFNIVMKPFPMLRYRVITVLIPYFMKYRAHQRKRQR